MWYILATWLGNYKSKKPIMLSLMLQKVMLVILITLQKCFSHYLGIESWETLYKLQIRTHTALMIDDINKNSVSIRSFTSKFVRSSFFFTISHVSFFIYTCLAGIIYSYKYLF